MAGSELVSAIASAPDQRSRRKLLDRLVRERGGEPGFTELMARLRTPQRIYAAALALERVPDEPQFVQPILDALTHGLGKTRSIQALIDLQHRLGRSSVLDDVLRGMLERTKLACPKCRKKFLREALIRHLWLRHQLLFDRGRAMSPRARVERSLNAAAASNNPRQVDRAYAESLALYQPLAPVQVHQALAARMELDDDELGPLRSYAGERSAGLCPRCYSTMPARMLPMPPPLAVSRARLCGEGIVVELGVVPPSRRRAAQSAMLVALLGFAATALIPAQSFPPIITAAFAVALSAIVFVVRSPRRAGWSRHDVVDAAWGDMATRVGRSPAAVRFLTRLCRTSLNYGNPQKRFEAVWSHVEHAAVLSGKNDETMQWFAAVRLLQAHDTARIGQDWVPNLAGMLAPLFRAEITPVYTEAIAQTLIESNRLERGDAARLRIALVGEAFEAGLLPGDLLELARICPALGLLLRLDESHLSGLHLVWKNRNRRPWESAAPARTAFEIAQSPASGDLLARHPDLLLQQRLSGAVGRELGSVVIGRRGVTLGGHTVGDSNTEIRVEAAGVGSRLIFGTHVIPSSLPLPPGFANTLTNWLQWVAAIPDPRDTGDGSGRLAAILAPITDRCRNCRQASIVRVGEVGIKMPLKGQE